MLIPSNSAMNCIHSRRKANAYLAYLTPQRLSEKVASVFVAKFYMVYWFVMLNEVKHIAFEWRFMNGKRGFSLRSKRQNRILFGYLFQVRTFRTSSFEANRQVNFVFSIRYNSAYTLHSFVAKASFFGCLPRALVCSEWFVVAVFLSC